MKITLEKTLFTSAMLTIDKKDYRESLRHIMIEFDVEKQILTIVGTDAQVMIIKKKRIENNATNPDLVEFCAKVFEEGKGYMLPETILKSKNPLVEFELLDGMLFCDGSKVSIFDGTMPNWKNVIPTDKLVPATYYCAFDPDFVKKIDKALGYKNNSIIDQRPFVSKSDSTCASDEALARHLWIDGDNWYSQMILLMPRRMDYK